MILNLLRVEDMTVEEMLKRSFSEFRKQALDAKRGGSGTGAGAGARHRAARGATCASCLRRTRDSSCDSTKRAPPALPFVAQRGSSSMPTPRYATRRSSFVRSSASMRSLATAAWRRWHPVEWCS